MLHRSLRYLIRTRWKNRVLSWVRRLRTPAGLAGALLIAALVAAMVFGRVYGTDLAMESRAAVFVAILGFMMIMGILSGLGQRGLVFIAADLDFVFPAPIPRRHLLVYHFVPHYLAAGFMAFVYVLAFGGTHFPSPWLFLLGAALCQVTNAHLSAFAAEVSVSLADRLYRRLRAVSITLIVIVVLAAMALVVGGLGKLGDVPGSLADVVRHRAVQVIFFPAVKAVELGTATDAGAQWTALAWLAALAAGSFVLVASLRVDFVEASFAATKRAWKRVDQMRRGVHAAKVRKSSRGPSGRLFQGAGAVLWLNALTMRRQLRAMLGGVLMVAVMLAVFSGRDGGGPLARMMLILLAMVPLWMPLPIGFRLPREQLLALRQLPLAPARLAAALITVPVFVPLVLQALAVAILIAIGNLDVSLALAIIPAYAVAGVTFVGIESHFVLKRPHPNSVNLLHSVAQIVLQGLALMPGMMCFALLFEITGSRVPSVLLASVVQAGVAYAILLWLGRRVQHGEIAVA